MRNGDGIGGAPLRGPWIWWCLAAGVALLAAAGWVRSADVPYLAAPRGATAALPSLAVAALATVLACALAARPVAHRATRAASLLLLAWCATAGIGEARLLQLETAWPVVAQSITDAGRTTMQAALAARARALDVAATAALGAPDDPAVAFARLREIAGRAGDAPGEIGLVLYHDSEPAAWAGTVRVAPPIDSAAFVVVRSAFYIALDATRRGPGGRRAVATVLLHAEPPADRLAAPLDLAVAARTGVPGFSLRDPAGVSGTPARAGDVSASGVFAPDGAALLVVEPIAPRRDWVGPRTAARWRDRAALVLAIALVAFIVAAWNPASPPAVRMAALLVPAITVAVVPLNAFSNASPAFDPTYFYSTVGGPFTSTVGALGLISALACLGALAAARAHGRIRWRPLAAIVAVGASAATPWIARGLADGITPPSSGIPLELWIVWQVTIALAAFALLVVAGIAARGVLPPGRGVPAGWPIGLAVAAALVGPLIWRPPGIWPLWYPALWSLVAVAVVFPRRPRALVLTASVIAGLGAAVLIWATSAQKRVGLAERDVAGLLEPDRNAEATLNRFGADLAASPAPRSRADLLTLYARSVLGAAGYPVSLATWWPGEAGGLTRGATLSLARFAVADSAARRAALLARGADSVVLDTAQGTPGVQLVLAVPNGAGGATSVVVAPSTRLIPDEPIAPMLGIVADTPTVPAYELSLVRMAPGSALAPHHWTRQDDQLHADWIVGGATGPERAHVEIDLRSLDALAERGVLLLLLDLLLVLALWVVAAAADGGFPRWLRARTLRWANSYRAQLTLVLFGFFLTPTVLFAAWSYRRLAADDAQSRALLVWETLRTVASESDPDDLVGAGQRLETPLLLYRDGALAATSDTLLAELAPLGRYLAPDVELGVGLAPEVTARRVERVAGAPTLVGFRAATDTSGEHVVLAAPARTNDIALDRRRGDLSILVLFAAAMGAMAALWLSGLAAREFARPIESLRRAALAAAAGEREPDLGGEPPAEFAPVFSAFRRMAADFGASQRVLAWGEMARQVAHEIKNPLTPIRLGMQHLLRARADGRSDFDRILQQTASRMLAEIDRLDSIARAFSRYGTAPEERPPGEPTDIGAVARDVVELERMGADDIAWSIEVDDGGTPPRAGPAVLLARARAEELREVLLNVLENARLARARRVAVSVARDPGHVVLTVRDDGDGIPPDVMPRIFEPRFSTRTSGSGLGLAISRRLVDGWGGSIAVSSEVGRGTVITISLVSARAAPSATAGIAG